MRGTKQGICSRLAWSALALLQAGGNPRERHTERSAARARTALLDNFPALRKGGVS